jgi:hypothetical protein
VAIQSRFYVFGYQLRTIYSKFALSKKPDLGYEQHFEESYCDLFGFDLGAGSEFAPVFAAFEELALRLQRVNREAQATFPLGVFRDIGPEISNFLKHVYFNCIKICSRLFGIILQIIY